MITKKLVQELQEFYSSFRKEGLRNFEKHLVTKPSLLRTFDALQEGRTKQATMLIVKGKTKRLYYACSECSAPHFGATAYCSSKCLTTASIRNARKTGWKILAVEPTMRSHRIRLRCKHCASEKAFGTDWVASTKSCQCQLGKKISDANRVDPSEFQAAVEAAHPHLRVVGEYLGMNQRVKYQCLRHTHVGMAFASNLAKGKACPSCGREKYRANSMAKYGAPHPASTHEVQAKIKRTMRRRYGVTHALQNKDLFEKMLKNSFTRTAVRLGTRTVYVQGYEPIAIRKLLRLGIEPADIAMGNDPRLPSFSWTHPDGSRRVYHPDIFVVSKNLIVEVKSLYTYFHGLKIIRLKRDAVKKAGYRFKFFVADPKTGEPINPHLCEP